MNEDFFTFKDEIPKEFYSDSNNRAFKNCSVCQRDLEEEMYVIEKSFKKYPNTSETFTVFEYAICMHCKEDMMREISKESLQKIKNYIAQNQKVIQEFIQKDVQELKQDWLSNCSVDGKSLAEMEEYNIIGFFFGKQMVQKPFVFGESFIEEYANLLSSETLDFFDDFMNQINNLPPSLAKLLNGQSPVII